MALPLLALLFVAAADPRIETQVLSALGKPDCAARIFATLGPKFAEARPQDQWVSWCTNAGTLKKVVSGDEQSVTIDTTTGRWEIPYRFNPVNGKIAQLGLKPVAIPLDDAPAAVNEAAPAKGSLSDAIADIQKRTGVPGLQVIAVDHGKVVAEAHSGVRRAGSPTTIGANDAWHLGSDTKAMTAALAAMFVDEGKLDWTTTVGDAFADWKDVNPGFKNVRLIDLLSHMSGLAAQVDDEAWKAGTREGIVHAMLARRPAPRAFLYSNVGYMTVGVILERSAQTTWEELMQKRLFDPLGMKSCGFGAPATPGKVDQPWAHDGNDKPIPPGPGSDNPPALGPAGTVHCALADWAKFVSMEMQAYNGEKTLISQASARKMTMPSEAPDYSLGWIVARASWASGPFLTHDGSNTVFHAVAAVAPARQLAFFAATNTGEGEACHQAISAAVKAVFGDSH